MSAGILLLCAAYILSQFFRAFLAVLTTFLDADIGATPDDLAFASGLWFVVFAACQIPIGAALDRIGPRRTAGWLHLIGAGGGSAVFALATAPLHINIAMALIGMGCAPVLMASYYIFARSYAPARFAFLASVMVAVGSLGNLVASYPMALTADLAGWRAALWGLSGMSAVVAIGILLIVKDPAPVEGETKGTLAELLRIRALWVIFPLLAVSYAFPGGLRGLWIGPYLADVFNANSSVIGQATLAMGLSMVIGSLLYGVVDARSPSRKWMIAIGTGLGMICGAVLLMFPTQSLTLSILAICGIGFFVATYPVLMAHGRSFLPPHLIGRGVTMLNLFSMGGVGVMQFISGRLYRASLPGKTAVAPYENVFALFMVVLVAGCVVYLFSRDAPKP
jgi:MFS family permease